jgi:predicted metalloprotease with PDZ domain
MEFSRCRNCGRSLLLVLLASSFLHIVLMPASSQAAVPTLRVEVDARDLPRRLLHTTMRVACEPGQLVLWYPKWIPGTHAPCGPVDTIGGLKLEAADGKAIPWRRDELELYRMTCDVPPGTHELHVQLDTICNAPAVDASGHLSYGNSSLGIINWPTCLLYPGGLTAHETQVELALRLPGGWHYATGLKATDEKAGLIRFAPVSLEVLGDSPLIAGEHMRTIALAAGVNPPAFLHLASESAAALELGRDVVDAYGRMVREAGAMFGFCHYPEFHFLVTCSDELRHLGLEHLSSSLNGVRERELIDAANRKGWVANLIPHEYVHSWCGKYRRPVGQCTADFHTPQRTPLLWVYEGLTEYLGELLMVRSGLVNPKDYRETLTSRIGDLMLRKGRSWRSLEDTAVAAHLLRASSPNWNELRRGQDFYFEGALLWLEADAIIRQKTQGARSLDDFCRRFLGKNTSSDDVVPYDLPEVIAHLDATTQHDWASFFKQRVSQPLDSLPLDVVSRIGYRLQYSPKPGQEDSGGRGFGLGRQPAIFSLGLSFGADGHIADVVPGMIGDRVGLAPGMKVMGVNSRLFSLQRLHDALADSVSKRKVELLLIEGDRFRTITIEYADGPRYLEMIRDDSKPDLLAEMLKPIADKMR